MSKQKASKATTVATPKVEPKNLAKTSNYSFQELLVILQKHGWKFIAVLSSLVFLFRYKNIGHLSLWVDEFVHCNDALHAVQNKPFLVDDKMGYLLTYSIIPFFKLFGINASVARIPSLLYGVLTIPILYYLGKRLFNSYVGIFTSLLFSVSLYATFWGRIARNYAIFGFFNILLIVVFIWAFFPKDKDPLLSKNPQWAKDLGFSLFPLILLPIVLFLDLSSHPLAFIMAFPMIVILFLKGVYTFYSNKEKKFKNIHIYLGTIGMAILLLMLTPQGKPLLQKILLTFVVSANTDWVLPNWDIIKEKYNSAEKNTVRDFYTAVFSTDLPKYYILGMYGALLPLLRKHFKTSIILLCFWVPFIVLSYIYREPNLPRYMYFIYPFLLMSIAIFFNEIFYWINKFIGIDKKIFSVLLIIPLIYLIIPAKKSLALINTKQQGQVVPKELSVWYFTAWNEALEQVAKKIKPEDIVITTGPWATTFYLQRDNNLWWRQLSYDKATRGWVAFSPPQRDAKGNGATNYEDLVKTFNNNKRGWVISDYYLYNVTTDPKCRDFVFKNMHHEFNSSADGSVDFFSWDKDNPLPGQNFVITLGKNENQMLSQPLNFTVSMLNNATTNVIITAEGIDNNEEVYAVINGNQSIYIPANSTNTRGDINLAISSEWLKSGENSIQFGYNANQSTLENPKKGAAIYDLKF